MDFGPIDNSAMANPSDLTYIDASYDLGGYTGPYYYNKVDGVRFAGDSV